MAINMTEIKELAKKGADSVFDYISRTAEPVEKNGIRWQTKSYNNEPQYSNTLFDGVTGISLFLSDYYRLTQKKQALELAKGALMWSESQETEGDIWQADKEGFYSQDFWCGAAGAGHFFLRLCSVDYIERPLG